MFFNREEELKVLKEELERDKTAVLVYGKRKIGKTTLILEAIKRYSNRTLIYYECIKDTIESNIKALSSELKRLKIMPSSFSFEENTFESFFSFLNDTNKEYAIVIDEYCYLKEREDSKKVDSIFQGIIDNKLDKISLFISGSQISMMRDLLEEKNALFGRFNCALELKEFNYLDASIFYKGLSPYEKVAFYSVFGGSPYLLEQIDSKKSLEENIKSLFLTKTNSAFLFVDSLLLTDMGNKININKIMSALKNDKKHYGELENILDKDRTGNLSKMLKPLLEIGLIRKDYPINKINQDKKATYQINDNAVRFYYTYIYDKKFLLERMDKEDFYDNFIEPTIIEYVSRRFEDICQSFIWQLAKQKKIKDVYNVGKYYYDDSENHTNGEFDLAIERKESFDIIEVKYLKNKLRKQDAEKELEQIKRIKELNVKNIGFISINGFEEDVKLDYLYDGNDIYFLK